MGEDQVKFNLYQSLRQPNEDKASCMRVDSLIPSKSELIFYFLEIDPLGIFLTKSLSVEELDCEEVVADPELVETILILKE